MAASAPLGKPAVPGRRTVVEDTLIPHTAFQTASARIEQCLDYVNGRNTPLHEVIIGESRSGKSTVLEEAEGKHPAFRTAEGRIVPVIRVKTDAKPTVKALAERMLHVLGDPRFDSGTENIKTLRLAALIRNAGVRMLMIDEFQHFYDQRSNRVMHHVADWLKNLADDTRIALVVAGLPTCRAVLDQNEQLSGRFMAPIVLRRFNWQMETDRAEFLGILNAFHTAISAHFDIPALGSEEMAFRCYCGSGGLIGHLAKFLQRAVHHAEDEGRATIGLENLAEATQDVVWSLETLPGLLNPFTRGFDPTPSSALLERIAKIGIAEAPEPRRKRRLESRPPTASQAIAGRRLQV